MDQFALQVAQVGPGGRRTIKKRMLARLQAIKMELRRRWHDPIKSCGDTRADLAGADLAGADLWNANLVGADLFEANLGGANLRHTNLRGADLGGANLRGASLFKADLREANLKDADLKGADLRSVKGVDCEDLKQTIGWERARRDPDLACGADIPQL